MTIPKKVSFIERVDRSRLGLEGLQKVVYSDRARHGENDIENEEYNFTTLGKKMLEEIDGDYIKKKYNTKPGKEFGMKLHEERIKWLKHQIAEDGLD